MSQQPQTHKPTQNAAPAAAPAKSEAVTTESKSDAFKRLAVARTNNVLNGIRVLSNLGSPNYEYTPQQVDAIFAAIDRAVNKAKDVLKNGRAAADAGFSL